MCSESVPCNWCIKFDLFDSCYITSVYWSLKPIRISPKQKGTNESGKDILTILVWTINCISLYSWSEVKIKKTSSQVPSYASPKLSPNDRLTGVKCRATSVAKNQSLSLTHKRCYHISKGQISMWNVFIYQVLLLSHKKYYPCCCIMWTQRVFSHGY